MMPGQTEKTGWNRRSSSSRPKKAAGDRADGDLPQHGTGTNGHANHVREASTPADVTKQPNMSQQ